MKRIIRRPKKVCTTNRLGKKKCFTIQARRRLNPEESRTFYVITNSAYFPIIKKFTNIFGASNYFDNLTIDKGFNAVLLFEDQFKNLKQEINKI